MPFTTVIFDLDGTLVDSLPGIEASTRQAVAKCLPDRTLPAMRELIGPPIATMLANLWPDLAPAQLDRLVATFRTHYDREGCRLAQLYPAVEGVLETLAHGGTAMYVLTNKPLKPTLTILEHVAIRHHFGDVVSPDIVQPSFTTKLEGARLLRDRHQPDPAATLIVGDGLDDLKAAEACGFAFAVAVYGYGSAARGANLADVPMLKTFSDILRIVL